MWGLKREQEYSDYFGGRRDNIRFLSGNKEFKEKFEGIIIM